MMVTPRPKRPSIPSFIAVDHKEELEAAVNESNEHLALAIPVDHFVSDNNQTRPANGRLTGRGTVVGLQKGNKRRTLTGDAKLKKKKAVNLHKVLPIARGRVRSLPCSSPARIMLPQTAGPRLQSPAVRLHPSSFTDRTPRIANASTTATAVCLVPGLHRSSQAQAA